jgi:hypothetical protein
MEIFNSKVSSGQITAAVPVDQGKGKKYKKGSTPGEVKPKRTHTSSFLLFCQEKRDQLKASGQQMSQVQISQLCGEAWKLVSEEQKAALKAKAEAMNAVTRQNAALNAKRVSAQPPVAF